MRVAIIGAGVSGLSCAHELKKNGIIPTIFEKKSFIGEIFDFQSLLINSANFPFYGNPFKYLHKNYNIDIKPQYNLKEILTYSPNKKLYSAKGNHGYIVKRGAASDSIENQIAQAVDLPIKFNTQVDINDIMEAFDYIVIATGNYIEPQQFTMFTTTFQALTRIATITGDFKTDSISTWWNMDYCNNGYAYLVPYSPIEARLILVVNGITSINELNRCWDNFLKIENITYAITEKRDLNHNVGFVDPVRVGKLYFTGVAGGFLTDTFGFGLINAIISGVTSARAIVYSKDYDKMMQKFKDDLKKKHEYRTAENTLNNKGIDVVFALSHLPVIKQIIFNFPLYKVSHTVFLVKIYNYFWRKLKGIYPIF